MLAISRALMSRQPRLLMLDDLRCPGGPNCWRATSGFASLILEVILGAEPTSSPMASIRGLIERAAVEGQPD
jgi:hypothetical protein